MLNIFHKRETSNTIAARTNTLITIITGSLIAFISYLITRLKNTETNTHSDRHHCLRPVLLL